MPASSVFTTRFWGGAELPMLLQTEASECGIACLAMVASHWGHRVDLANLRRRFPISLKGATLDVVVHMAQALGLHSRTLRLDLAQLDKLKTPCVLHWDMSHFVVLKSVRLGRVVIHDPAVGVRAMSMDEVSKHFTGIAVELSPGPSFRPQSEVQQFSLRSLMGHVTGLKRGMAQLLLVGVALQVCALVAPFYLQWLVDEALVADDRDLITVLGVGFLLLVVMQTVIGAVRSWMTTVLSTHMNFQWFGNAFAHLMRLPLPFFEKRHLGDIVSRFGSIQAIQRLLTTQFVEAVIDGLLVTGTAFVMLAYSVALTLVSVAAVGLYAMLRWSLFDRLRTATSEQIVYAAKQQSFFMESARGAQSIRLFDRAEERRSGWMNLLADQFNADVRIARLTISHQTANALLFNSERVIVIWMAAIAVLDHRFSVGMLFAFLSYKDQFSQRISALIDKLYEFRMLRLHGERVADIVLAEPEEDRHEVERDGRTLEASIELRDVAFRYADGEPWVLRGLNLSIPAGQCIAITGASGCGKTTLVKLLLGLLEPSEGEIRVGGVPMRRIGLANYRRLIGTVMQDDQLFAGSIADNIAFFDPAPSQQHIESCARLAAIDDEIAAMPMGYNTLVGDIGSGLSGGQKQRILLARALYKNPRLLCLDEATSHLDLANEQRVNAAVRGIALTRILVAHRPETIATAQRVVVLERGQIARDLEQAAVSLPARMVPQAD
jgi:ATP-binding cassette subfamily B protein RaxB